MSYPTAPTLRSTRAASDYDVETPQNNPPRKVGGYSSILRYCRAAPFLTSLPLRPHLYPPPPPDTWPHLRLYSRNRAEGAGREEYHFLVGSHRAKGDSGAKHGSVHGGGPDLKIAPNRAVSSKSLGPPPPVTLPSPHPINVVSTKKKKTVPFKK